MYSLGIDIGCFAVKLVLLETETGAVKYQAYMAHKGSVRDTLKNEIQKLYLVCAADEISFGAVTGSAGKRLCEDGVISLVNEVAAIVEGGLAISGNVGSIIEIGGQSAKYITDFSEDDKSRIKVAMNDSCSAGTGSFIEEQASRLRLELEDFAGHAARGRTVPRIAGRCSVFAKTDITHHQQEGVPVEDILLGLSHAMVRNYRGAVMGKLPRKKPLLFAGGVARNQAIINAFKAELKLDDSDLIVSELAYVSGALGAAVLAVGNGLRLDMTCLLELLDAADEFLLEDGGGEALPCLVGFGNNDSSGKHQCMPFQADGSAAAYWLGIDVGSTSTNLVLSDKDARVVWFKYLRTLGDPVTAVKDGLHQMRAELGEGIRIMGVGTTGSGRHLIGRLVGADVVKDEITCQAKAATAMDASVDTVFEIGGQDSKYICLEDGAVKDFRMNKVCAAGTGSFIEEQAQKFAIPIDDFGDLALAGLDPTHLGERCTVFMETSMAAHLGRGAAMEDIAAGLCYAVVKNYLNRVVGQQPIGHRIFLQGGVAYNQGIINAFRSLTGKDVQVAPFFSVTGAYGVSIIAREDMTDGCTKFKGFDPDFDDAAIQGPGISASKNMDVFNRQMEDIVFHGYEGKIDPARKTVGIPRALFTYGMFSMFETVFKELGFNVILSDPTNDETIRLGQEYSLAEACYPIKLINGHVAELIRKKVDFIFFPDLYTVDHPGSQTRQNYGCAYMQLAFKVVNQAMDLKGKGIELLAPTIAFNLGKEFMMKSFADLGKQLGKTQAETMAAFGKGMVAMHAFEERLAARGRDVLGAIGPDEKAFVLISKIYGVADPVLNMGIPGKLMDMGYRVLGFYDLPEGDMAAEHPNMYWPFGQHILEPAGFIKAHPKPYAILLTHHGCGPDAGLVQYFDELMDGKPYLNIEVDEHSSDVGVITRLEAFVNSLGRQPLKQAEKPEVYADAIEHLQVNIKTDMAGINPDQPIYLPYFYPYSAIFEKLLVSGGINAIALPQTDRRSIELGRQHTRTNEYFSLTALLGDVLRQVEKIKGQAAGAAVLIPQTEGAEIDGQMSRFIRAKLDEQGYRGVDILSPFVEDALGRPEDEMLLIFMGLLAGDLVMYAPAENRGKYLEAVIDLIGEGSLGIATLTELARQICRENESGGRKILAIGEPLILFNDILNDYLLREMEEKGHRVIYAPLSEYLWIMWRDFAIQGKMNLLAEKLDEFKDAMKSVTTCFPAGSPFEPDLNDLIARADRTIGYYAGDFGRYRMAKILGELIGVDGIITLSSTYENTEISLNILRKGLEDRHMKPVLNLSFDGNRDANDQTKIESFLYYL